MCRRLARGHYENFLVGTLFLPRPLRQHFFNIYAYCRTADDLADESASPAEASQRLDQWEEELNACFAGRPRHPIFVALAETVQRFDLRKEPFADLLSAFRQDQQVTEYARFDDLLDYCRRSADPVGRIILGLAGISDAQRIAWSDSICTALQLTNFWQDLRRDLARGRCYVPLEDFDRFGIQPQDLSQLARDPRARGLVRFQVERAETYFRQGMPLADRVPRWLERDIRMFIAGGRAVLAAISRQQYNVWDRRPVISKSKQLMLILRVALGKQT